MFLVCVCLIRRRDRGSEARSTTPRGGAASSHALMSRQPLHTHAAGAPRLVRNSVLSRGAACLSWGSERKTACLSQPVVLVADGALFMTKRSALWKIARAVIRGLRPSAKRAIW